MDSNTLRESHNQVLSVLILIYLTRGPFFLPDSLQFDLDATTPIRSAEPPCVLSLDRLLTFLFSLSRILYLCAPGLTHPTRPRCSTLDHLLSHRPIPSRIREALRAFAQCIDPSFIGMPSQLTPTRLYSSFIQRCGLGGHEQEVECGLSQLKPQEIASPAL